jgi:hypothetical protein
MSLVFRDTPIIELFEMIARKERINIVLGRGVAGNFAVNLYNMTSRQAIFAIAEAGGYTVTVREKASTGSAPPVSRRAPREGWLSASSTTTSKCS